MSVILAFCCAILLKYISRGLNEGLIGICHLRVENVKLCEQMREKSTDTFRTVILVFLSGTALMTNYLTEEGCKPNSRYRQMC